MDHIEPYYNWRGYYIASEDEKSPFFNREYSEFEYTHSIYNYLIHPQWDYIDSPTLYCKLLFADYESSFAIIEMLGEWNDCIQNDIMFFKREVIDVLLLHKINKFILICENILIFHADDDCYYQEWFDDAEDGWIAAINFQNHVQKDFEKANIDYYLAMGGQLNQINWRTMNPIQVYEFVESLMIKRLGA